MSQNLKCFLKEVRMTFIEIFNFSSKVIKEKQPEAVIVMAGAAGMFPKNKNIGNQFYQK
jgi:hypothetical protein